MPHPKDTPLEKWPPAWLKMEVASLLDTPGYVMMTDMERGDASYPVSLEQMRAFIRNRKARPMRGDDIPHDYPPPRSDLEKARGARRHKLPPGACAYCDRETGSFHPSHDASSGCESGKRSHCSCDTCF